MLIVTTPPPRGGLLVEWFSDQKTRGRGTPLKNNPNFFKKLELAFRGGPLPLISWFGTDLTKNTPYVYIYICISRGEYMCVHICIYINIYTYEWVMFHINESCPIWTNYVHYFFTWDSTLPPPVWRDWQFVHMGHDSFIWDTTQLFVRQW